MTTETKSNIWVESNAKIYNTPPHKEISVEKSIYELSFCQRTGFYLKNIAKHFAFPSKIYDLDENFITKVVKSYNYHSKNIGVLLNGIKGGGKTFTAKMIAERCNVPIILINHCFEGMVSFLSMIDFDCVIFIDEYEKCFAGDERGVLLSLMDGMQTSQNKIMFLLTTNQMTINENLINRPSRIRYVKNYNQLSKDVIIQIINDRLQNKSYYDDAVDTIGSISQITLDSVIEILNEVNIHDEKPSNFISYFNVNQGKRACTYIFTKASTGEKLFEFKTDIYFSPSTPTSLRYGCINRHELELSKDFINPTYILFKKHIGYDHSIIQYLNPEYAKISHIIDSEEYETPDLTAAEVNELYLKLIEDRDKIDQYLTEEVKYSVTYDKNWQFS